MSTAQGSSGGSVQEYSIRVPKNTKKKYQVMRFTSSVNVDFSKWTQVKMERENNMKEFRGTEEDMPKFRGNREGGVAENASYYVFTHAPDGAIEAFPLQEWYNFQPIQRYKRNKVFNYFSFMLRQRLRPGDEEGDPEDQEEGKPKKPSAAKKELKISDMDEWIDSDDDDDSDSDEEKKDKEDKDENDKNKKNKKGDDAKKKKKKKDSDDEAFEESDDGDEEGRELDYISDSSVSVSDHEQQANKELKGVAEEDALRKLLSSGEEDEDEEEQKEEGEKDSELEEKNKTEAEKAGGSQNNKDKAPAGANSSVTNSNSSSELSSDSSDSDSDPKKKQTKDGKTKEPSSGASSRSGTPTKEEAGKRKLAGTPEPGMSGLPNSKRARLDNFSSAALSPYYNAGTGGSDSGITEDAVRRYLMRKPMTTTELLQKFKSKKTGLTSDQLVNIMTQILKRINPVKQTIKGKMYLSIKA
ncbi:General transcription factor IIF subunit 1 [Blattella germanica]|nr:General transcription factor IIF subunit 1 [Blattella germanica]